MLIPKYWAQYKQRFDSKIANSITLKQATIKRYGWSDVSQNEALNHAKARVSEAHNRWIAGEDIVRRERKEQYNQSNSIPIREQIIAEHDFPTNKLTTQLIVTRNSYGAQVANVNNVGIIDVDNLDIFHHLYPNGYFVDDVIGIESETISSNNQPSSMKFQVAIFVNTSILLAGLIAWLGLSWLWLIAVMLLAMAYLWQQASAKEQTQQQANKQRYEDHLAELLPFITGLLQQRVASYPNETFRLYQTPAGFRIIATHDTVLPNNEVVAEWFVYFYADANYARLCQSQQCFRARLTAKPWRMIEVIEQNKMEKDIPSRDFFFIDLDLDDASINALDDEEYADFEKQQNELAARQQWIEAYDNFAKSYRSCEYIESFAGVESKLAQAAISDFIQWHDSACQVDKDLPLA